MSSTGETRSSPVRDSNPARELRLEPVDSLEEVRAEWTELAAASGNVFSTWEWASAWWRHFGNRHSLALVRVRSADGQTVALLPLCRRWLAGLRILRFIGYGPADQLGPVCRPEDDAVAAHALGRALGSVCADHDVFVGDHLPGPGRWAERLGATVLRREASPVVRFEERSWSEYMAAHSRNFRGQAGRRERRLAREHRLSFRLCERAGGLAADFDTLVALHDARWDGASSAFAGVRGDFHRDFAALALRRGWCRLWVMEVDDQPAAAWYGLRFGVAESYYQAGRDPAREAWSVGFVLLVHTMREANRDGMSEYRMLRGDEAYKERFSVDDPGVETIALGRGVAGRAAVGAARAVDALPGSGQRLVRRLTER